MVLEPYVQSSRKQQVENQSSAMSSEIAFWDIKQGYKFDDQHSLNSHRSVLREVRAVDVDACAFLVEPGKYHRMMDAALYQVNPVGEDGQSLVKITSKVSRYG
jgi:hypothetical protein